MKKILNTAAILSLVLASMSFAITVKDTTILGKDYAKVSSCADLNQISTWTKNGTVVNAIVMQDISCDMDFDPIGQTEKVPYRGIFDGNGKTISGLKFKKAKDVSDNDSYTGFFGLVGKDASVKNLTIASSSIKEVAKKTGILAGLNYGVITNCFVLSSNTVDAGGGEDVGGVVGRNGGYGTMSGCVNYATVKGGDNAGGIAGANTGAISNSANYGAISGKNVGGIVGSVHYRSTNADSTFVPGRIALCQNVGSVSGTNHIGGIAGDNKNGNINNCRNDGAVAGTDWSNDVGGVVGYTYFDNDSKYSKGNYTASVTNSFSTTESLTGITVGGVVGRVDNNSKTSSYSYVGNCYYDSDKKSGAKAIGSTSSSKTEKVSGKPTKDMFANESFVELLNGKNSFWLFASDDYPQLNFGSDLGAFKVTFKVNGNFYFEATTEAGIMVEKVKNPSESNFKAWKDEFGGVYSSAEANTRKYDRSVTYEAVFKSMFTIVFLADYGAVLAKMSIEEGSQIFFADENGSEIPADYDAGDVIYKFVKWNPEVLGVATKNDTIIGVFDKIQKAFDVKFFVQGKPYGETQKVKINEAAVAPADPVVDGFRFDGWNKDFSKVTANLDVDAVLTPVTVYCKNTDGAVKCDTVPVDTIITIPPTGSNDSITCVWKDGEKVYQGGEEVKASEIDTLVLECTVNTFDVTFVAKTEVVDEQNVAYGDSAKTPAADKIPTFAGFRFTNWIEDYSRITAPLTVNANFVETVNVCFGAGEFAPAECEDHEKDSVITIPDLPKVPGEDGFTCTEWTLNGESFEGPTFTASEKAEFVAKCHKNFFDVKFYVLHEKVDEQKVAYGTAAKAPADPEIKNWRFDGWDTDFSNVVTDLVVTANMTEMVEVCFGDTCKTVPAGSTIIAPSVPSSDSLNCTAWQSGTTIVKAGDEVKVDANMKFETVCSVNVFEVKFFVLDNQYGETQKVAYGASAKAPADPSVEGWRFLGWDKVFSKITENLNVTANMKELTNVCTQFADEDPECINDVPVDTVIVIPALPDDDSLTCTAWTDGVNTYKPGDVVKAGDIKGTLVAVCTVNEFEVKFFVLNNQYGDAQKVAYGASAKAPADPSVNGWRFLGWDKSFSRITANLDVIANMKELTNVCTQFAGEEPNCIPDVPVDTDIVIPALPDDDSLTCTAWTDGENTYKPGDVVKAGDIKGTLVAVCTVNEFDVKFFVLTDKIDSQKVKYGAAAIAPANPSVKGFRFLGWDKDFSRITANLDVNADMKELVDVCTQFAGEEPNCTPDVPVDTVIVIPELPGNDSLTCSAWTDGVNTYNPGDSVKAGDLKGTLTAVCTVNEFAVKFIVLDTTVKTESVAYGAAATAPADSEVAREGYRFDGWDTTFAHIVADLDVNAKMTKMTVVCREYDGETVCDTVPADSMVVVPGFPKSDSVTCSAWTDGENTFAPGDSVKASEIKGTLTAVCEYNKFDVKFVAFDTVLVDSQVVTYGQAAVEPADSIIPVFEGYRFLDWDADFTSVTSDLVVNAMFDTLVKINIVAEVGGVKMDTTFFVLKDTTITGAREWQKMIEKAAGDGHTCVAFIDGKAVESDTLQVSKDIEVSVNCDLDVKIVSFYAFDSLLAKVEVFYGFAADFDAPVVPNKRFIGWSADLKKITEDMDVNALYVDVDTIRVMVNGEAVDVFEIAKDDSVIYVLPEVKNTEDSTFLGWKVDGKDYDIGDTVVLKFGSEIFADFEEATAIHAKRNVASFSVRSENGQLQVIGARVGDMMTVLDLQGRVILQKTVQNSVEMVNIANRGNYLVRVGYQTKRVVVR